MSTRLPIVLCTLLLAAGFARGMNDHPSELDSDRKPRLHTGGSCVIRNVTIHSAVAPAFAGDVLVKDGKIVAVGKVDAPASTLEIDGAGEHLAPGVVDCHSHIAIEGSVNEGTVSISAEVRIADVIDSEDVSIWRALAGGVTTARLLHGSANAIGGQDQVIKLKWGRTADDLRFDAGPRGIKFALGENPKRSNGRGRSERFPSSRMGVEAVFERAFARAREYMAEWHAYAERKQRGENPAPPRRDLRLDTLAGILKGEVRVHSHCYRADEIVMLLRVAQRFGFQIATLQHVLEGYKVAQELAEAGVGGSTFSDWWAYKIEAYDAIPQNAALMDEAGVLSSVNSDSAELMRHLYEEAAKSVRYAGMDPVRALALATINPARQLGLEKRIGSIEVGKDADLVLLSGDPLSALARVEWTMVDGEIEFERRDAFGLDKDPPKLRELAEPAQPERALGGDLVAITNAVLHPITGPAIEKGTLLFAAGRIVALGAEIPIPAGARTIDAAGRHVYPGLVALDTNIGLLEIGSVPATDDQGEDGGDQPDVRTAASVNADSAHIGVTRTNGITRVQTAPSGGGPLLGQSAVMRLAGSTWEEMLTLDRDMLHVRFPRIPNEHKQGKDEKDPEEIQTLRRSFEEAREYGRLRDLAQAGKAVAPRFDPRLESLVPFALGLKPVALHASNAATILRALRFAKDQKLKAVLFGAAEGWKVADAIAREKVPVAVGPVLALPGAREDPYDAAYANPAVLSRAGVDIAITAATDENTRNLSFHAATACAYGLPHEEALRAITYYPARMLGLEKDFGSLAPGKVADVIVTNGDVLESTSTVDYVFIDGVQQPLGNRQTELYERYRSRMLAWKQKPAGAAK
ncbi:MAG: amidohydrolase family protein [Planctomycetes bacterium]|nr:amidohydrolase family protein [Planctomycetota bacterium]